MSLPADFLLNSISMDRLVKCLDENPSLRGYLQGYIAEEKLRDLLESDPEISEVHKIPDRDRTKGDFGFKWKDKNYRVELKTLGSVQEDVLNGGHKGSVILKTTSTRVIDEDLNITTSCLDRDRFEILAISTVNSSMSWDFLFVSTKYVPSASVGYDYLTSSYKINTKDTPMLKADIKDVLLDMD